VTFEILSKAIAISSNKDTVVRGKNFVVTITGESKQNYWVFVKDASLSNQMSTQKSSRGSLVLTHNYDDQRADLGIEEDDFKLPTSAP
jgi:hypothetical protein